MLSSAETIDVIAETLQAHKVPAIVLDPVNSRSPESFDCKITDLTIGDGFNQRIATSSRESC
jgi:hypothetical protein